MALPKTRTSGALALALIAAATFWFFAVKKHAQPELAPQRTETVRADAIAAPLARQHSVGQQPDEPPQVVPAPSAGERAAAVKRMLTLAMGAEREKITKDLVEQGLSLADAEQMARRAVEGIADCLFDAARSQYAAQGNLSEFLDHTEIDWVLAATNLSRVRVVMAPCLANVRQQTGLPSPVDQPVNGSPDERVTLPPPPPPWAAEMGTRIRDHIASHPGLGVTDVFVQCRDEGCSAMLVGSDIQIFDFDFDVFAEQNGFKKAVVGGERDRRSVWLER
jgi:hypothetical protein